MYDFEVETGSRDELQGYEQKDTALKDEERLAARERLGTSGDERADRRSRHERTVVMATGSRRR